jgi:hypothetical protein
LEWLQRCFEPATREKANAEWRILTLDGHSSHVTWNFILHYREHRIVLLCLIPHTSHLCQPLDVGLFSPLKTTLSAHIHPLLQTQVSKVKKSEWVKRFALAQ